MYKNTALTWLKPALPHALKICLPLSRDMFQPPFRMSAVYQIGGWAASVHKGVFKTPLLMRKRRAISGVFLTRR
jgi:hypothetical protein